MIKISELTAKGADLQTTDLLEISEATADGYTSKSITGEEIINAAQSGLQAELVSGTNIKTINGSSLLGSGDLSITASASWGSITGTLSSQTDLQSALDSKQATLVSGTNIKTINGSSLLGSGDITISGGSLTIGTTAISSGTVGRILFQGTGNVLQQSANIFWDNTNGRLGIGTSTPAHSFEVKNTTGGASTPTLSLATSTYSSQIIVGNSTYPYASGANSLNIYHAVAGTIAFYNGSASPTLRMSILSDGKTIIGSATTASKIFEVNNQINGGGIGLNTSGVSNTQISITHTTAGGNNWAFNSAANGSSQTAGTLSIGSTTNNMLLFSNGNIVLGASSSVDAGFKLDVNGTARIQNVLTLASLSADPTGANGMIYYNTTSGVFRVYQSGAWKTITTV